MENLDELLTGEEPEEKQVTKETIGLDDLHISRYVYEKAFRYAKLVMKKRRSVEIGGFLTKPEDAEDRVARDAFLARDQEVSKSLYRLNAEDVHKAGKELEKEGQRIVGWWHSHGRFDTFHSKTDDENQMVLLNQISPSNYVAITREKEHGVQSRVEGENVVFWDSENPSTTFELKLREESPELVADRLKVTEEKQIGFAYSFVVNHHRWVRRRVPYCEIATRDLCRYCMGADDVSKRVGYEIFDDGDFEIDDGQLLAEIAERVYVNGQRRKLGNYFLPEVFEKHRTEGTLTKPKMPIDAPVISTGFGEVRTAVRKTGGKKE